MALRTTKQHNRQLVAEGIRAVTMNGDVYLLCPVCHEYRPVELRMTGDGVVRNQPRCSTCRGGRKPRTRRTLKQLGLFACLLLAHCGGGSFSAGSAEPIHEEQAQDAHEDSLEDVTHLDPPAPSPDGGQEASEGEKDSMADAENALDSAAEVGTDAAPLFCFDCYGAKVCEPCCVICQGGTYCAPGCPR